MRRVRALLGWTLGVLCVLAGLAVLALGVFRWDAVEREVYDASALAPPTGRLVKANDVELFVQEAGKPEASAVVFVHGTGAWSEAWRPTIEAVAAAGYRAIALDLPPFGFSSRPAASDYSKPAQARRIQAALQSLGLGRAVLVGHSFGGGPTTETALLDPNRVRALVLVDAALSIEPDGGLPLGADRPSPAAMRGFLACEPLRDGVVATFLTNPSFTPWLIRAFVDRKDAVTREWVAIYQKPLAVRGTTPAIGRWLPELVGPARVARSEVPVSYGALGMPVFAIWGDRDTITPLEQGQRLVKLAPRGKISVIDGVGHIPQIEDSARFNRVLLGILERVHRE